MSHLPASVGPAMAIAAPEPAPSLAEAMALSGNARSTGGVNLGVFAVHWQESGDRLIITIDLGIQGVLSKRWEVELSFLNPEVTVGDSINLFFGSAGASITVGIDDRTGHLYARAAWDIFGARDALEITIPILRPFEFGLLSAGVLRAGVDRFLPDIIRLGLDFHKVNQVKGTVVDAAHRTGVAPADAFAFLRDQGTVMTALLDTARGMGPAAASAIQRLSPQDMERAMVAVFQDPEFLELYPHLKDKIAFSTDYSEDVPVRRRRSDGVDLSTLDAAEKSDRGLKLAVEILTGLAAIGGLTATVLIAFGGLLIAIASATALTGIGTPAAALLLVVGMIIVATGIAVGVLAIMLIIVAMILGGVLIYSSDSMVGDPIAIRQAALQLRLPAPA
jgi:hypothetical protein